MLQSIRTFVLVVGLLGTAGSLVAQDPQTERGGNAKLTPTPAALKAPGKETVRPLVTLEGKEEWGKTGELVFQMYQGVRAVMIDETKKPVEGSYRVVGNRLTLTFQNCVYDATEVNGVIAGRARYTSGPAAGKAWNFRVTVRNPLVGRTFGGDETLSGYGPVSFRFVDANTVEMTDKDGVTRGSYTQNGLSVTMTFGNATYAGEIRGNSVSGTATNGRDNWTFQVAAK